MEHIAITCERHKVILAVRDRINLSREEVDGLLALAVEGSITCNCARRHRREELRLRLVLERLVTDAVLQARGIRARQALGNQAGAEEVRKQVLQKGKSGWFGGEKEGKLIRIDFKNRRRII